jgi:hypothetical protein
MDLVRVRIWLLERAVVRSTGRGQEGGWARWRIGDW